MQSQLWRRGRRHDSRRDGGATTSVVTSSSSAFSVFDQIEEGLVDAGIGREFGVEGGGHGSSLPNGYRIGAFGGEDFDAFADALDFRGADEHHLEGRSRGIVGEIGEEFPFADGAVDLTSVGVAANADVESSKSGLRRIFDFGGEQDCSSAGAEGGLEANKLFELFESGFARSFRKVPDSPPGITNPSI